MFKIDVTVCGCSLKPGATILILAASSAILSDDGGSVVNRAGFGRGFDAVDVVGLEGAGLVGAGLVSTDLPGARLSGFDGRCSCSSAFRFVPDMATFFSEEASRDGVLGLRTSDFAVEDETGGSGRRDVVGGIADGLPVSMDVSTESRN